MDYSKKETFNITFKNNIYWSCVTKVDYLQRLILVCCISYYELNENFVTDTRFDQIVKQYKLMYAMLTPVQQQSTRYYYVLKDLSDVSLFETIYILTQEDKQVIYDKAVDVLKRRTGGKE